MLTVKKSSCKCYYYGKFGCRFKKSCNFPSCKFYTTNIPETPIKSRKEYLQIKYDQEDKKLGITEILDKRIKEKI
jgi:hypothetical protein